jgi:hypothetical protein
MATGISTRLELIDRISAPIMNVTNAVNAMTAQFANVQNAADIDSSSLERMKGILSISEMTTEQMRENIEFAEGINKNTNAQEGFNSHLKQGANLADNLGSKISKIMGMIGLAFSAKAAFDFFKGSIELTNTQINAEQQLANVLANQGANEADFIGLKREAASIQSGGMYGDEAMIGGAAELSTYLKDASAVEQMMGTLANYAAGMSGGAEVGYQEMVDYATQLGKALDGTYDGLKKKGFELSDAQKEIIENGSDMEKALVIDEVINQSWAGLYDQMAKTPTGKIASMKNAFGDIREEVGARLLPAVISFVDTINERMPQIQQILDGFAVGVQYIIAVVQSAVEIVTNVFTSLIPVFQRVGDFISNNIQPILIALGVAAAWFGVQALIAGAQAFAAFVFANLPLMLTIAIILGIIMKLHSLGASFEEIFGVIGGIVGVTVAFIWDLFLGLLEFILGVFNYLVNPIIAWVNFFGNVFKDPIASIIHLFGSLADNVLGILQKIASALDFVFGSHMADTVQGWRDSLSSKIEIAAETYGNGKYEEVMSALDLSVEDLGLNRMEYGDAWNTGKGIGENIGGALDNFDLGSMLNFPELEYGGFNATDDLLSSIADNTAATAGNTANSADYSEEELKLWRDIAERDTINRYTTVEIDMGGFTTNNTVNSEVDLDGIVDYIANGVEETLMAIPQGVFE